MTDGSMTSSGGLDGVTIEEEQPDTGVRLVLDAERRIREVHLDERRMPRRPADLAAAVLDAHRRADGERLAASAEASGDAEGWWRAQAARRPTTRRPRTSRAAHAERGGRHRRPDAQREERRSVSGNGFVTMTWGASGLLRSVDIDGSWLSGASPARVEASLREAGRRTEGAS